MGLKESGLRGSLRSTSSVLPAFFDVTITNTNSPVQEGDILTVDYSADNTGDAQDTQDIRLEIDSVEEDRDSDITLLGAQSTTGTLEWDTTDEDETTYTATVLSDDDSDSVTVEIEAAIPDSVVARYDATEDSLGGVSTIEDLEGNFDLTGSCTVISDGIGGMQTYHFDGTEDMRNSNIQIATPNVTLMVAKWNEEASTSSVGYDSISGNARRQFDGQDGEWRIFSGDVQRGGSVDQDEHLFAHHGNASGTNDKLEVDDSTEINADSGNAEIDTFVLASDDDVPNYADLFVGELVHMGDPTQAEIDAERSRLNDKWFGGSGN